MGPLWHALLKLLWGLVLLYYCNVWKQTERIKIVDVVASVKCTFNTTEHSYSYRRHLQLCYDSDCSYTWFYISFDCVYCVGCDFIFFISYPFYYFTVLFLSYCVSFVSCYCGSVSDHLVLLLLINLIWFDLNFLLNRGGKLNHIRWHIYSVITVAYQKLFEPDNYC